MIRTIYRLKPSSHYLWRFGCLAALCLLGISILETWPSKINSFHHGLFHDKNYVNALSEGYSGSHADYLIKQIVDATLENIIVIIILSLLVLGIMGFINDTCLVIKTLSKKLRPLN